MFMEVQYFIVTEANSCRIRPFYNRPFLAKLSLIFGKLRQLGACIIRLIFWILFGIRQIPWIPGNLSFEGLTLSFSRILLVFWKN